jgi:hypothetical protein
MKPYKELPKWIAFLFICIGAYIVLISLDIIPYNVDYARSKRAVFKDPHHWQITCIGAAFLFTGFQIFMGNQNKRLSFMNGLVILPCFLVPMIWFLYFSGAVGLALQLIGSIPLFLGGAGAIYGLIRTAQGKSSIVNSHYDPIAEAKIYASYGRTAQARQVLNAALKKYPERADEIKQSLEKLKV